MQQAAHPLEELDISAPTLALVKREGFKSAEELALCARPHLEQLLGHAVVSELELSLIRLGLHFSLSRREKLAAIKQMAVSTHRLQGPTAGVSYFIDAINHLLASTAEQNDAWLPRTSQLFSGPLTSPEIFARAIDAVYSEIFPEMS